MPGCTYGEIFVRHVDVDPDPIDPRNLEHGLRRRGVRSRIDQPVRDDRVVRRVEVRLRELRAEHVELAPRPAAACDCCAFTFCSADDVVAQADDGVVVRLLALERSSLATAAAASPRRSLACKAVCSDRRRALRCRAKLSRFEPSASLVWTCTGYPTTAPCAAAEYCAACACACESCACSVDGSIVASSSPLCTMSPMFTLICVIVPLCWKASVDCSSGAIWPSSVR